MQTNFMLSNKTKTPFLNMNSRNSLKNIILFTNARDEKNIKEWVAHHLLLGFDIIYIFDHKSVKPLSEELKIFKKGVIVERCEMEPPIKMPLMIKASKIAKSANADWMLYLDADEFLFLNTFKNIKQLLSYFKVADSIAINWLMFGSNFHKKEPDGLIIENYTKSDLKLNKHVKCFVRPSQVVNATNPHFFEVSNSQLMFSLNGKRMTNAKMFNEWDIEYYKCPAFIAHYAYQSEESYFKRKINLPRDDNSQFRSIEENIHSKHNETENLLVRNKYANSIKEIMNKLLI